MKQSKLQESVNRRTDNTMVKRKRSKVQTMIYKTLHRKRETRTLLFKPGMNSDAPE
jgi:hypothetical protein